MRMDNESTTLAAREVISLAGMQFSFPDAAERFPGKVSGIHVSASLVRAVTETIGRLAHQREAENKLWDNSRAWNFAVDNRGKSIGYISVDHTGVRQQGEEASQQPCRMAAVGMLYNPPLNANDNQPIEDRRYVSGLLDLPEVGRRLREHAWQVGLDKVDTRIAITDAGAGIVDMLEQTFPDVECIVDFWHAAEHVAEVARALHPGDEASSESQFHAWRRVLKTQGGSGMLAVLETLDTSAGPEKLRKAQTEAVRYLGNHQSRMDYPQYIANGWRIGSGPVEAGCKKLVCERLKGSGMRWKEPGTHEVCQLRAVFLSSSNAWDQLWQSTAA